MLCIIIETASGAVGDRWKLCSCSPHHPLCGSVKLYASLNCSQSDRAKSEKKRKRKEKRKKQLLQHHIGFETHPCHQPLRGNAPAKEASDFKQRNCDQYTTAWQRYFSFPERADKKDTQIWFNLLSTFCKSNELYKPKIICFSMKVLERHTWEFCFCLVFNLVTLSAEFTFQNSYNPYCNFLKLWLRFGLV